MRTAGLAASSQTRTTSTAMRCGGWACGALAAVGAVTLGLMSGQLPRQCTADAACGQRVCRPRSAGRSERAGKPARSAAARGGDRDAEQRPRSPFSRLSSLEQGLDVVTGSIKKIDDKPAAMPWPDARLRRCIGAPIARRASRSAPAQQRSPRRHQQQLHHPRCRRQQPRSRPRHQVNGARTGGGRRTQRHAGRHCRAFRRQLRRPRRQRLRPCRFPTRCPQPLRPNRSRPTNPQWRWPTSVIDLGAANSINGLRALWRGLARSHKTQLDGLRPLIAVQERRSGLGLQLRLIAGPITNAAAAARICAVLSDADRTARRRRSTVSGFRLQRSLSRGADARSQRMTCAPTPAAPAQPPRRRRARHSLAR